MRHLWLTAILFAFVAVPNLSAAEPKKTDATIPLRNWSVPFDQFKPQSASAGGKFKATTESLPSAATSFTAIAPCRLIDTRPNAFAAGETRTYTIAGNCGAPVAVAYSLNFTIVGFSPSGVFLTAYPADLASRPGTSTVNSGPNASYAVANAAIVPASGTGQISVYASGETQMIVDINGYFTAAAGGGSASSSNTPNTLALRDANGDFSMRDLTARNINATQVIGAVYQDVAEWVPSPDMPAGTVVVLDPADGRRVLPSSKSYDTSVAGVVSANPGIVLGPAGPGKSQIATTGRVKVFVDATNGPIKPGDLLVTSSISGMAMKSQPMIVNGRSIHQPGTIIGKALEPLESGKGEILVLLSLQ